MAPHTPDGESFNDDVLIIWACHCLSLMIDKALTRGSRYPGYQGIFWQNHYPSPTRGSVLHYPAQKPGTRGTRGSADSRVTVTESV